MEDKGESKVSNTKKKVKKENINIKEKEPKVQKYKLERKKEKMTFDKIKEKVEKNKKKYRPIILAIIALIIVILITTLVINIVSNIRYSKFSKYESKIKTYGFEKIYKNNSSRTTEMVTRIEGIKLAVSAMINQTDISGIAKEYDGFEDEQWVRYAEFFGIIDRDSVSAENKDEIIDYEELVKYFSRAKERFTERNITGNDKVVLSNAAKYDSRTQIIFGDFVESKIIQVETSNIDASQKAFKGLANELTVNSLEQMFLISNYKERLRNTEMPSNSNDYPYVLFDISQKIYNYSFIKSNDKEFISPTELYKNIKDAYPYIISDIENYFNNLYSVDYINFKASDMINYLNTFSGSVPLLDELKSYCDDAIKRKIKIETVAKVIEPCIYYDGESYRARVELKIKILSADTKENLLFGDSKFGKITYNKDEYTVYIDAEFGYSDNLSMVYVKNIYGTLSNALNKSDLDIKIEKTKD